VSADPNYWIARGGLEGIVSRRFQTQPRKETSMLKTKLVQLLGQCLVALGTGGPAAVTPVVNGILTVVEGTAINLLATKVPIPFIGTLLEKATTGINAEIDAAIAALGQVTAAEGQKLEAGSAPPAVIVPPAPAAAKS
jgi:hypothetical protein